jgi:hypothetical protein
MREDTAVQTVAPPEGRGTYFPKRAYRDKPLPEWPVLRLQLPRPLWPEEPELVDAYWHAWELVCAHFRRPPLGSTLVSNYLDPCADGNLRMWDAVCTARVLDLAHDLVPGIRSLDNFYCCQHPDGEICREITPAGADYEPWVNREGLPLFSRRSGRPADLGRPAPTPPPALTLDGMSHPLLAWAELESYRQTGDAERLALVWDALWQHYLALRTHLRHASGLYVADWSYMDNSPRNPHLGCGVDASSQMVLVGRSLAEIGAVVARLADAGGQRQRALAVRRAAAEAAADAEQTAAAIRDRLWDPTTGFFYDLRPDGQRSPVPTAAAFWTLLAGVATPEQAAHLARWLQDPQAFGRTHRVPSLPACAPGYDPRGGYFRGAVWPPLVLVVVLGLRRYGLDELACAVAMEHVRQVARVRAETGTFWENYAPDAPAPGRPARPDFVGWGALGPIALWLEFGIGLRANAPLRELEWTVRTTSAVGCERYWFAGTRVNLQAAPRSAPDAPLHVTVEADKPIQLVVRTAGRRVSRRVAGRVELVV